MYFVIILVRVRRIIGLSLRIRRRLDDIHSVYYILSAEPTQLEIDNFVDFKCYHSLFQLLEKTLLRDCAIASPTMNSQNTR